MTNPLRRVSVAGTAIGALLAWSACGPPPDVTYDYVSPPLALDSVCAAGGCVVGGSGRITTGFMSGTVGLVVGPGPGQVTIPLPTQGLSATYSYENGYEVDILATSNGVSFSATCVSTGCGEAGTSTVTQQSSGQGFDWIPVGQLTCGASCPAAMLEIDTNDATTVVQIADVRLAVEDHSDECSLSPWAHRHARWLGHIVR